jgi:hypothetical protein
MGLRQLARHNPESERKSVVLSEGLFTTPHQFADDCVAEATAGSEDYVYLGVFGHEFILRILQTIFVFPTLFIP